MNLQNILLLGNDMIIPRDPMDWGNPWTNEAQVSCDDDEDSLLVGQDLEQEPDLAVEACCFGRSSQRQHGPKTFVSETEGVRKHTE